MLLWLTLLFLFIYSFLILFYLYHWRKLPAYPGAVPKPGIKASVVVAARNEAANIGNLLSAIKNQQNPPPFEIIVVDDYSEDETPLIVERFDLDAKRLIRPEVPLQLSSKKKAIETGVRSANGNLIIATDADCFPGPEWLATLTGFAQEKQASFIAAPVKYIHTGGMASIFQSLDFMMLQGITAASVHGRFHTMCNGANLAYRKQSFLDVNGFEGIDQVATGDDMLLMHKIWKKNPESVLYLKSRKAIVQTLPASDWKEFYSQRKRWASKTLIYDDKRIIFVLAFVYLFNLLFLFLLFASFFNPVYFKLVAVYLLGKTLIELPFMYSVTGFFEERKMLWLLLPFQPLHIFYVILVGLTSQFGKYEWKGRRTK